MYTLAPLLLEEKGLGDEVHATKERPEDDSVSLSMSIEEKNQPEPGTVN
jgi:hypothetical protein